MAIIIIVKVISEIHQSEWNTFVREHPDGSIFQTSEMMDLFNAANKFKPLLLGVYDENVLCGVLLGVFIHEREGIGKLLSSRFVIYGGPLLIGEAEQQTKSLDALLKALILHTKRKALFIQLRNFFDWQDLIPVFENNGFSYLERLNYIIQVQGSEDPSTSSGQAPVQGVMEVVRGKMSESRRRQIEKALKSGAEIIEPGSIEQVKEFYDILYKLYRYKVRKPLADWSFFENFYQFTSPAPEPVLSLSKGPSSLVPRPPIGIIRLVKYDGRIIGGILAPVFEKKCIYEWYVCGLDKEYKEQYPSVLATWAALDYAINNNIESFDFMGVGKPDVPYGVRDFKARFGGELVNYGRLTRINNRFLYHIAELGYNVLALMKRI